MTSGNATRHSACLCDAVNITFIGRDKGAVLCHCTNCKQTSGSAFMHNHRFLKATIDVTKGLDNLRQYADSNTKSGVTLYRHFCSKCGCPLYLSNSTFPGFVAMASGNFKQGKAQPAIELFPEDKYAWIGEVTSKGEAKL